MKNGIEELETLFQALGDRTRLRLLNLMNGTEVCVCFFVEALDEAQPKVSRHLAYLRSAGLVDARRDGKWMHYSLSAPMNPRAREVFESVLMSIAAEPEMVRDRAALARACCSPRVPELLKRAPKPDLGATSP